MSEQACPECKRLRTENLDLRGRLDVPMNEKLDVLRETIGKYRDVVGAARGLHVEPSGLLNDVGGRLARALARLSAWKDPRDD